MKFKEPKAIYLQIADRICDEIVQGRYAEEERVPSVREYAALVEVNVNTAMRSYEYLQSAQIIYNKRGIGYFVSPGAREEILTMRRRQFLREELPDLFRTAYTLGLPMEEMLHQYADWEQREKKNEDHLSS